MGCAGSVFIPNEKLRKYKTMSAAERAFKAAILIQKWYRRYLARQEVKRRCSWTIFQTLEYAGEQDQVKLFNFFNDLITHVNTANPFFAASIAFSQYQALPAKTTPDNSEKDDKELLKKTNPDSITVEDNYRGPHLFLPLKSEHIRALVDLFRLKKRLHGKYVLTLIHGARRILKYKPNINFSSTALSRQVTICGDLHGNLEDLLTIFFKNGLPSRENPYIFNGDYVDRGVQSMEILLLLLACFVVYPDAVFLNRGNHEDFSMNIRYGFFREVMVKYPKHGNRILQAIEDLYSWLPLATIIDNKVFVVHGGVGEDTSLKDIAKINRNKFTTILRPNGRKGNSTGDRQEWKQVVDLLWSDPRQQEGCSPNVFRGGGSFFGPDVTRAFLERHHLDLIIRSHQCKVDGYEFSHDEKLLTIFSASNYYDVGSNKGAYVKLVGPTLFPHIVMYISNQNSRYSTIRQRQGYMEQSAIKELKQHILDCKDQLMEGFLALDKGKQGYVKLSEWCTVMEKVVGLRLPWRLLCAKVAKYSEKSDKVEYRTTLEQYFPDITFTDNDSTLFDALYKKKDSLEAVFRIIDKDGSGSISMEEFSEACALLGEHMGKSLSPESIRDIALSLDMNKDGMIDLNEFLEAFRLVTLEGDNNRKSTEQSPSSSSDSSEDSEEDRV